MSAKYFTQINPVMTDEQKAEILALQENRLYLDNATGDSEADGNYYSKLDDRFDYPIEYDLNGYKLLGKGRFCKTRL